METFPSKMPSTVRCDVVQFLVRGRFKIVCSSTDWLVAHLMLQKATKSTSNGRARQLMNGHMTIYGERTLWTLTESEKEVNQLGR